MSKRFANCVLVTLTLVAGGGASVGTASAAAQWKGPFDSHGKCILSSGENRGLHWINVKRECKKHDDGKWWYQTRW